MFHLPEYKKPDFQAPRFLAAPEIQTRPAPGDGILPENYYATNIYPNISRSPGSGG